MALPVIVATDDRFAMACGVVMESAFQATPTPIEFILFHSGVSPENMSRLRQIVASRPASELRLIDAEETLRSLPMPARSESYSRMIYARLAAPEILSEVDRALYLDTDTLVRADLRVLFQWDLQGRPLAAVRDYAAERHALKCDEERRYYQRVLGDRPPRDYFNSGVLVMDLDQCRRRGLGVKAIRHIHENPQLRFPDQDALNLVAEGNVVYLPERWNTMVFEESITYDPFAPPALQTRIKAAFEDPAIIHYAGYKPWSPFPINLRKQFTDVVRQTPWRRMRISHRDLTWKQRLRLVKAWRGQIVRLRVRRHEIVLQLLGRPPVLHWRRPI
ncbi:MAG: glycosyltransferase family 8 protein [Planctomycetota bacterium]